MREITIQAGERPLAALLHRPHDVAGVVVLVHGSGIDRHDRRNRRFAARLRSAGFATLQPDLLDAREAREPQNVFDVELQGARLVELIDWLRTEPWARELPLGLHGSGMGASIALLAAAKRPREVRAVVCSDGRPDCCTYALPQVKAATLLLAPEPDWPYRHVYESLETEKDLFVAARRDLLGQRALPEEAAEAACRWFARHLVHARPRAETRVA